MIKILVKRKSSRSY